MLILLFALLLLLGATSEEYRKTDNWGKLVLDDFKNRGMEPPPLDENSSSAFSGLIQSVNKNAKSDEPISDTWTRIGDVLDQLISDNDQNFSETISKQGQQLSNQEKEIEKLKDELNKLTADAESSDSYTNALIKQIDLMQAGTTPPCLFKAPTGEDNNLRGPSVPIALIKIEDNLFTFSSLNLIELQQPLVDFWGRSVDVTYLVEYLRSIPVEKMLETQTFRDLSQPIREMGEVDNETHGKCMFTSDFWMDDFVPLNMFTQVFQSFYLPQARRSGVEGGN
jgi:hypothetical protein